MSSRGERNATDSHVRRMYIRGRKGKIKVEVLPLEDALARAKMGPKRRSAKPASRTLASKEPVVAVSPQVVQERLAASRDKKSKKKRWSVGYSRASSVMRLKTPLVPADQSAVATKPVLLQKSIAQVSNKVNQAAKPKARGKKKKEKKLDRSSNATAANHPATQKAPARKRRYAVLKYEGQPRFVDGFRIVQGGLPESGRRY